MQITDLVLKNVVEAWTLPMGSFSRLIRAQSQHAPGYVSSVGLGTFVDPKTGTGGALNDKAKRSSFDLVSRVNVHGKEYLMYRAIPIDVAIIRATTADLNGNLSLEEESVICDQLNIAMAAKNSGGVVIAQVKRIGAPGSLPARNVDVPGCFVDCVVKVDPKDHDEWHPMSFATRHDPALTGEIKTPRDAIARAPLDLRKVIGRRGAMSLRPGYVVNLGIGIPESVAQVAAEEDMLDHISLTTEVGAFGGVPSKYYV